MMFRTFSYVHTRLLLYLQADIQQLEQELDDMDKISQESSEGAERLRSWCEDKKICQEEKAQGHRTREDVLNDLNTKILRYGSVEVYHAISR
jgi:hypothetical protein